MMRYKMNITRLLRVAALLLACLTLFCACGRKPSKLSLENNAFREKNADGVAVSYQKAPVTYRATSALTDAPVFLATGYLSEDFPLYAIENTNSDELLTDDYFDLYYADSYTLPTLVEMKPYMLSLCTVGESSATELERLDEENQAAIDGIVSLLTTSPSYSSEKLLGHEVSATYELLFHSKDYPEFFYVLEYWKFDTEVSFAEGDGEITVEKGVVYDRAERRFYVIGKQLETYFINAQNA